MPHATIRLYPGRSQAQKQRIAEEVTKAIMTAIGSSEASISVSVEDVAPGDWVEQVYKPEIIGKPDVLFKKPGYDPL